LLARNRIEIFEIEDGAGDAPSFSFPATPWRVEIIQSSNRE
jgi:hypothetical protein